MERLPRALGAFRVHGDQKTGTQPDLGQERDRLMRRVHGRADAARRRRCGGRRPTCAATCRSTRCTGCETGSRCSRLAPWAQSDQAPRRVRRGTDGGPAALLPVPGDRPAQPLLQRRGGVEAEQLRARRSVQAAARLAVGLGRVPDDLARRSPSARAISSARSLIVISLAAAEVHRLGAVVALRRRARSPRRSRPRRGTRATASPCPSTSTSSRRRWPRLDRTCGSGPG